jgi:hypothetical protein
MRSYCRYRIEYRGRGQFVFPQQRIRSTTDLRGDAALFAHQNDLQRQCPIQCGRNADTEVRQSIRSWRSVARRRGSLGPVHACWAVLSPGGTESVQNCTDPCVRRGAQCRINSKRPFLGRAGGREFDCAPACYRRAKCLDSGSLQQLRLRQNGHLAQSAGR